MCAAFVFLVGGVGLSVLNGFGLILGVVAAFAGRPGAAGLAITGVLTVLGVLAAIHGLRALIWPGSV